MTSCEIIGHFYSRTPVPNAALLPWLLPRALFPFPLTLVSSILIMARGGLVLLMFLSLESCWEVCTREFSCQWKVLTIISFKYLFQCYALLMRDNSADAGTFGMTYNFLKIWSLFFSLVLPILQTGKFLYLHLHCNIIYLTFYIFQYSRYNKYSTCTSIYSIYILFYIHYLYIHILLTLQQHRF